MDRQPNDHFTHNQAADGEWNQRMDIQVRPASFVLCLVVS